MNSETLQQAERLLNRKHRTVGIGDGLLTINQGRVCIKATAPRHNDGRGNRPLQVSIDHINRAMVAIESADFSEALEAIREGREQFEIGVAAL